MIITTASVFVDDQEKALAFYTNVLGFEKKTDVPTGEHRWLTVVSPSFPDGVELLLEPDEHPAAKVFKAALAEDGIPFNSFGVEDAVAETERLGALLDFSGLVVVPVLGHGFRLAPATEPRRGTRSGSGFHRCRPAWRR